MRSIKISDYFELRKPTYKYIQIIPHKSIRNYNSNNIAKAIANTYRSINRRIYREKKKLIIEYEFKISYIVDIDNNNTNFYFIVPTFFLNIALEKINEIWNKATIKVLEEELKPFSDKAESYSLSYKKLDGLSLKVDKKLNEPLNSILSVMDIMKEGDRVMLCYNFIPRSQFGFLEKYEETENKFKNRESLDKPIINFDYIVKNLMLNILKIMDNLIEVINDFTGTNENDKGKSVYESMLGIMNHQNNFENSKYKKTSQVIDTQILINSESVDKTRRSNNALSVCQALRIMDGDNELKYKPIKTKINLEDFSFKNCKISTMSTEEVGQLIQIPGRTLLTRLGIKHVRTEEINIPKELTSGYIKLGENTYKGIKTQAFIEDDKEIGSLPLLIMGRQGGGKTCYLVNYCKNVLARGESIVHIDFIKGCEASKSIEKIVPKEKLIILDLTTEEGLQSLAYNEVKFENNMSWFKKQELANKKTQLTNELINSINENGEPLSPKMERFLCACTDIMYLKEEVTLKDIIRCLQDFKYREKIINDIPKELKEELEEEIRTLQELDEWSKATRDTPSIKIGTRESKIEGILDRITLLKKEFHMKKMFNKSPINNLNFSKVLEEGKVVLIRMPQAKFKDYAKNIITTFFITKIWCACEIRGDKNEDLLRTHVIIDELSQCKTAERFMESKLTETRKYRLKFTLTGQFLDQLDKKTVYSLKGAGASFMLLNGSIKEDFNYFKDELDDVFEYEDLKNAGRFTSLNIIQYSKGYSSFITKLPKPI